MLVVLAQLVLGRHEDLGVVDNAVGRDRPVGADSEEGYDGFVGWGMHAEKLFAEAGWGFRDEDDGSHILAVEQREELDESAHNESGHSDRRIAEHVGEELFAEPLVGDGDTAGPTLCD